MLDFRAGPVLAAWWLLFALSATAQSTGYTVLGTVILTRTGERTPFFINEAYAQLTSVGAQQAHSAGSFFRQRYITGPASSGSPTTIQAFSNARIDNDQVFVQATDDQFMSATAQAFMQGLYPATTLNQTTGTFDGSFVTANDTYVEFPLNGYQYPELHFPSYLDPQYIYLRGAMMCPTYAASDIGYYTSKEFLALANATLPLYGIIGSSLLPGILAPSGWNFGSAYRIYDYLSYQANHNSTVRDMLLEDNNSTTRGFLDALRSLANEKQFALNGDLSADSGIRAIAGRTMAAKIMGQLERLVDTSGFGPKLSVLVAEYDAFLALFSLLGLSNINDDFKGIPEFASSIVVELFSIDGSTASANITSNGPTRTDLDESALRVRFYFRNGTDEATTAAGGLQSYPIFGRGPRETDLRWADFQKEMGNIMLSEVGDWCDVCQSTALFCPAFDDANGFSYSSRAKGKLSAPVAGVIGAIVALAVAGLLFALAMLLGGVRMCRVERRKPSLGGFKGSKKLASDTDLVIPKNGAAPGVAAVGDVKDESKGHERVGSWELKDSKGGATRDGLGDGGRPSFDRDEDIAQSLGHAVRPDERV